ncbi:MAG: 4-(cytidine 5'-diphospho)-2-C-methyl-D-erythritol kinase [Bacteroidia bacterium]
MICFPNAKINIGLRILEKRADGYHNIESIFYPIGWSDALELIPVDGYGKIELNLSGIPVPGRRNDDNLCVKLYKLLLKKYKLPSVKVWLHKAIPIGAGLGGGSSDAAHFVKMLNNLFDLKLSNEEMKSYVATLGSDCVFFIENIPVLASGRGEVTEAIKLDLGSYFIAIVYPEIPISTPFAYGLVSPKQRNDSLKAAILSKKPGEWENSVSNDFEKPLFEKYPLIEEVKNTIYKEGALYTSLTGSGSAVYGIFDKKVDIATKFPDFKTWSGELKANQ